MVTDTDSSLKSAKKLSTDVQVWESRLIFLQNEEGNLKRKNDEIKKNIDASLALATQELDKHRNKIREENSKLDESKADLETKKNEFQGILNEFNKEKRIFESERQKMVDRDTDVQKKNERLNNFLVYLRRESEKL